MVIYYDCPNTFFWPKKSLLGITLYGIWKYDLIINTIYYESSKYLWLFANAACNRKRQSFRKMSLLLFTLFFGGLGTVLVCIVNHIELSSMILIFYIGVAAIALIMLSIQYTIFYLVGELKSQQVMGLIRMIPGFLLFILGSIAMDIIQEESNSNLVFSFLTWIENHLFECILLTFFIAILIFLAGIFISVKIQKKRDFG